ncbi:MAG: hypothetical protein ACXV5H_03380 [Halobacteriota archaeon]
MKLLPKVFKGIKKAHSAKGRDYLTDELANVDVYFFLEKVSDIGVIRKKKRSTSFRRLELRDLETVQGTVLGRN